MAAHKPSLERLLALRPVLLFQVQARAQAVLRSTTCRVSTLLWFSATLSLTESFTVGDGSGVVYDPILVPLREEFSHYKVKLAGGVDGAIYNMVRGSLHRISVFSMSL